MPLSLFLAVMLIVGMGFAAYRARLCTVLAVMEVMTSGTAYMLASFQRASIHQAYAMRKAA